MKSKPKTKVLFLITKSNWGGAQRYVYDLATSLPADHYDVVVALGGDGPLATHLRSSHIRTLSLASLQRDVSLKNDWQTFQKLRDILATERPDVLHVNSSKAGGIGALAGRLARTRAIVYTAHGWAFNEDRGWLSRQLVAFFHWLTILLAHRTIAVSAAIKRQFAWPFVQKRMTVIRNGIRPLELQDRTQARHELLEHLPHLAQYTDDPWGVTIAELHPVKQHQITIRAVASLRDQGIPYRHIIIGEGEEHNALANLIHTLDLSNHVYLAGHHTGAATWLPAFDVFVLSSRSEALGYVLLEALMARLPIVASNVGGIPEIVPQTAPHQLVTSGDITALGNAIKRTLAASGEERSVSEVAIPTLRDMQAETTAIYQELLKR